MHNRKIRWFSGMIVLLLVFLLVALPVTAYGDDGAGTGNSQGVFKPLGLTSATLEDNTSIIDAVNVPLNPKIAMLFDKNVVYMIYWERNKKCFHLYGDNNRELALNISKIDDTVDFTKRQYIWVEPVKELAPETEYRLYVAPELLAKNGGSTLAMTTNNQGVTIKFKTARQKTDSLATNSPVKGGDEKPPVVNNEKLLADSNEKLPAVAAASAEPEISAAVPVTETYIAQNNASPRGEAPANSATPEQSDAGLSSGPQAPSKLNDADFAAQQRSRQIQNYAADIAVVLLLVWLVYELLRRKKKKDMMR